MVLWLEALLGVCASLPLSAKLALFLEQRANRHLTEQVVAGRLPFGAPQELRAPPSDGRLAGKREGDGRAAYKSLSDPAREGPSRKDLKDRLGQAGLREPLQWLKWQRKLHTMMAKYERPLNEGVI